MLRQWTNFDRVAAFMRAYQQDVKQHAEFPDRDIVRLRLDLIEEEFFELRDAILKEDIVEVADALTDLLYVVYGTGHAFGIDLDDCFNEVHRSNMSKLGQDGKPIYREDGKVLKGPNFFPPDLDKVVFQK